MEHQWSALSMRLVDLIHAVCVVQLMLWVSPNMLVAEHQQWFILVITITSVLLIYPNLGLYRTWRGGSKATELFSAGTCWTVSFVMINLSFELAYQSNTFELVSLLHWYSIGLLSFLTYKLILRKTLEHYRAKGLNARNIIVIGEGKVLDTVISHLESTPLAGFRIFGVFGQENVKGYNYLGDNDALEAYFSEGLPTEVDEVWIAMPLAQEEQIKHIMIALRNVIHTIRYVPDLFGFQLVNHSSADIAGLSLFNVSMSPMHGINRIVKRAEDIVISCFILALIWPVMLVIAILVKMTSTGPIFYKQERVSWNGKVFDMLKFRSMSITHETESVQWGGAKHKQVTRIGKCIRATSLDELPQFINVLKGDMSIVGPRPERTVFVEQFKNEIPGYMQKHLVKAGITGWAQINGWRGDTDLHQRIQHDLTYVSNWSLWFDIKIIIKTCFKLTNNAE